MRKIIILSLLLIALFSFLVVAQEEHDFTKAKQLIDSQISCDSLTNEQLESIGDYYMEQMHPREAHEYMDKMMGGEGSESLKQVHINIARRIYCNENVGGMMGGGYGMMRNWGYGFGGMWIFGWLFMVLILVALVLFIIWLVKQLQNDKGRR